MKHVVPAVALATALLAVPASAQLMTLYSQLEQAHVDGLPDQDFEPTFNAFDSTAADDFVVPPPGWLLYRIRTVGSTGVSGGATVDVTIRTNVIGGGNPHLPGAAVCTYNDVVPSDDFAGSLTIDLPSPCELGAGIYWLQLQVAQNSATHGNHEWRTSTTQRNSEAVWQNPGAGFGTNCEIGWWPMSGCGIVAPTTYDLLFQLLGQLQPVPLHDQTDSPGAGLVPDQDFQPAFDIFDAQAADDFEIADPLGWIVTRLETVGQTGVAGGATLDVAIHENSGGLPGAALCQGANLPPRSDSGGSFSVDLPTPCTLAMGTYWLVLQTNQNSSTHGAHYWRGRSASSGLPAAWRNPGNGYGTGCTSWSSVASCAPNGATESDLLFRVMGTNTTIFSDGFETGNTAAWAGCVGCS